jgi:uncharacterized protein
MEHEISFDVARVAQHVRLQESQVAATIQLLDDGNTIPFITRFRKDQTEGLNESQIRAIKTELNQQRSLIDRKKTILKSIESQGHLTDDLRAQILESDSFKRLEDLYLPFRPKRQTLAATARQQGLEPFAKELLDRTDIELATRALDYVRVDRGVQNVEQVYEGVGHLLAETYSESLEVRQELRKLLWETGKIITRKIESESELNVAEQPAASSGPAAKPEKTAASDNQSTAPSPESTSTKPASTKPPSPDAETPSDSQPIGNAKPLTKVPLPEQAANETEVKAEPAESKPAQSEPTHSGSTTSTTSTATTSVKMPAAESSTGDSSLQNSAGEPQVDTSNSSAPTATTSQDQSSTQPANTQQPQQGERPKKKPKRKKKKKPVNKAENVFKDFFEFEEKIKTIPPHRILAINRGERAKVLRVKIEADMQQVQAIARRILVPEDHPHRDFLFRCVQDSLQRLILPSLEREIRRELTDTAEHHAVRVFAKNLRNLLLQPPLNRHRVLAMDPGYQSGCRYAIVDEFGRALATGVQHIVGNGERIEKEQLELVETIRKHAVTAIAIGNGAACRETEKMVAAMIQEHFAGSPVAYLIVNEAGASAYSTSVIGREELPDVDPVFRSAISIGRRLLDPLSELVKISPENLGIGMYQHDVKAKHLHDQLTEVVESCVNFVGVDVNTASPALLTYIAGLNQLTARRVYEHRLQHGPFRNREQFKTIPGFGEVTFVQSAGFLRILDGDEPLDATAIHPESYDLARKILKKLNVDLAEIVDASKISAASQQPAPAKETSTQNTAGKNPADASHVENATPASATPASATPASATPENATPENATPENATSENATSESVTEKRSPEITVETAAASLTDHAQQADSHNAETATTNQPQSDSETNQASPGKAESATVSAPPAHSANVAAPSSVVDTANVVDPVIAARSKAQLDAWREQVKQVDIRSLANELQVGQLLLRDILNSITRPTRDPRDSLPKPNFRREILKIDDLEKGMMIRGRVVNVVDFGTFVDIGLGESSLVHVSQLSKRYINDPHEVVAIGDLLKLWVTDVDKSRRRIHLTAIDPSPRPPRKRPERSGEQKQTNRGREPQSKRHEKPRPVQSRRDNKKFQRKPAKPKPVTPITKEMQEGREPMRSFSDLQQFFKKPKDES